MRNIQSTPTSWYSIILSILTIWFLLVLTTSTLNLVLQEMQDGRGKQDYMKSYAAAEWGMELALLEIKEKGYGYAEPLLDSQILWNGRKDPMLSYSYDSKVVTHSWSLNGFKTDVIPLFWIDELWITHSVNAISLSWSNEVVWNLIGKQSGASGKWWFWANTSVWEKSVSTISGNSDFIFDNTWDVASFLASNTGSYLTLYNPNSTSLSYSVNSTNPTEFFSKPAATILSQAKVGKYTQNLKTFVDNTEFLWILKYSIYSWN